MASTVYETEISGSATRITHSQIANYDNEEARSSSARFFFFLRIFFFRVSPGKTLLAGVTSSPVRHESRIVTRQR